MKIDLEQIKDCDHCSHIFGSLGCCDAVNNEWVYSCKEGQKKYLLDRVLAIIDENENFMYEMCGSSLVSPDEIREAVKALKGEHDDR